MSFRRIDMRELNKSDHADYVVLSRRFTYCDKHIAFPYLKELGILLTSHPGNRGFLKASVDTHAETKLWITLAYDNYFDPDNNSIGWDYVMPSREVIDKCNALVMGPHQRWGGVLYPYFYLLDLGINSMGNFPYVYCANGDCILEKPEGIFELLDVLKENNADLISAGWWDGDRPIFNSTGFIGRMDAVKAMMQHFKENFIPLKAYERTCMEFGNCEGRMGRAIKDLGLKVVPVENPKNEQMHEPGHGTFAKVLGFRHVHAEAGWAWKMKGTEPRVYSPEVKYFDEKYIGGADLEFAKNNQPKKD